MSDRDDNSFGDDPVDLALTREVASLNREIEPSRDLWPGIERKIAEYPRRHKRVWDSDWMPYGVAASLVFAVASLVVALTQVSPATPEFVSYDRSIDNMQAEYVRVKSPLVQAFDETNQDLDPDVLEDLYRNIEIMEQARREIEDQVRKNPENRRLVEMLMRLHQQEVDLLKRDYTQPTRSM